MSEIKIRNFDDKNNVVKALVDAGYTVKAQYFERQLFAVPNAYWLITFYEEKLPRTMQGEELA